MWGRHFIYGAILLAQFLFISNAHATDGQPFLQNSSFDKGIDGWTSWQGILKQQLLYTGNYVGKVTHDGNIAHTAFTIDDSPDTIPVTQPNMQYTARAMVRAASAGTVGKTLKLVIRERSPAGKPEVWIQTSSQIKLNNKFQQIVVHATTKGAGNILDVYAGITEGAQPQDAFYIDDINFSATLALGAQFHCAWSSYDDTTRQQVVGKLADNGAQWVRIDVGWDGFEPSDPQAGNARSSWYTDMVDRCVSFAKSRQLKILMTVHQTPGWANGNLENSYPPINFQYFTNFMTWLANRYSTVEAFEIWNEPDARQSFLKISQSDPYGVIRAATYGALLQSGYKGVKAGNPNALVVFGAPSYNDDTFIRQVYEIGGAKDNFDVMATHPYQAVGDAPPDYPDDGNIWWFTHLPKVRDLMVEKGDGHKQIWLTEYGWSEGRTDLHVDDNSSRRVTLDQQAQYLKDAVAYAKQHYPYVGMMIWYKERAKTLGSDVSPTSRASIEEGYALMEEDLTPRPALGALHDAAATLGN